MRNNYNTRFKRQKKDFEPEYDTYGYMDFDVMGFVQSINECDEYDTLIFNIDNPVVKNNINTIIIQIPIHDDFADIYEGDHIKVHGYIRSWWNKELKKTTYSFEAQYWERVLDEEETKPAKPKRHVRPNIEVSNNGTK
jgi:hypothetical protein